MSADWSGRSPLARRRWMQQWPCWSAVFQSLAWSAAAKALPGESKVDATGFDPAKLARALKFPRDHGAHPGFRTEWWYATGLLYPVSPDAEPIGFQVTFFRSATGQARDNPSRFAPRQLIFTHAALALASEGKLIHEQSAQRAGFDRLTEMSEADTQLRSLAWSFKRANQRMAQIDPLQEGSRYSIFLNTASFDLDLNLTTILPPLLQGSQGFSQKGPNPAKSSHYYSRPQLDVQGQVLLRQRKNKRENHPEAKTYRGKAWLDHEWSNEVLDETAAGWDWVGLNLNNGHSLMAFQIRPKIAGEPLWSEARAFDADGQINFLIPASDPPSVRRQRITFKPKKLWRSPRSNALYPVEMMIELQTSATQERRLLKLSPLMDDQEIDARASTGGYYWEGLVFVYEGDQKIGQGYLELTGYAAPMKI